MKNVVLLCLLVFANLSAGCQTKRIKPGKMNDESKRCGIDTVTFGAGCFWCTEAVFREVKGVIKVTPGYSGGNVKNPSYEDVCTGTTGHAEVCQVIYDTEIITFDELLEVFWLIHDPTTLNRQGNDVGTQYRSVIFYHEEYQNDEAKEYLAMLDSAKAFPEKIVTSIEPIRNFYKAEDYHQNFYNLNKSQPYCRFVVGPKIDKFRKVFADKLKKEAQKN